MDKRRLLAIILLAVAILIIMSVPIWLFTPLGANVLNSTDLNGPPLTPIAYTPLPRSKPQAVLIPKGAPDALTATEAILMDADTGAILYEKNGETPVPMASTTKIMTALIAVQSGKLNQMVTVGQDAVEEVAQNGGSGAKLVAGDQVKLQDLVYGLMLPSGDDAAVAIADALAGSTHSFVNIMNVEAQRLHLFQTRYANVDGLEVTNDQGLPLDGFHYTTPYDLARLTRYALRLPLFSQVVQTKEYDLPATAAHHAYAWKNINTLLSDYNGTIGVKTGWTPQAGGCLVAAATRNGHTLISVVLHATGPANTMDQDDLARANDAKTLLNWGFGLPVQAPRI